MGGWWRWALLSPDGVAPSRMVGVSASINLPLHHKVPKFSSGTGSPGWSQKKSRKMVVVVVVVVVETGTHATTKLFTYLWSPYGIEQTIYIFMLWFVLCSFFFFLA